jgi:hypothetical protein
MRVVFPPIQPNLLGFIYRANQKPDANGEQFHIRQRDPYVSRDNQSFVKNAVQNIY